MDFVGEYYRKNKDCVGPERWRAHVEDKDGSKVSTCEVEVLDFIGALTRLLKPRLIVELGTNAGIAAEVFVDNMPDYAKLLTCDWDAEMYELAKERLKKNGRAFVFHTDMESMSKQIPEGVVDLLFVDSGNSRKRELELWTPKLTEVGVVMVHDTDTERKFRKEVEEYAESAGLVWVHLPTPRGLTLARKRG